MHSEKVVLKFPPHIVREPIVYHLIKDYDLRVSIMRASINPDEAGQMVLAMEGNKKQLEAGREYLEKERRAAPAAFEGRALARRPVRALHRVHLRLPDGGAAGGPVHHDRVVRQRQVHRLRAVYPGVHLQGDGDPVLMRLSTRGRYGLRAMMDIALYGAEGPVNLKEISARQEISVDYLEQLLRRLRKAGLVRSVRGPHGGFALAKPSEKVHVWEILAALEPDIAPVFCVDEKLLARVPKKRCHADEPLRDAPPLARPGRTDACLSAKQVAPRPRRVQRSNLQRVRAGRAGDLPDLIAEDGPASDLPFVHSALRTPHSTLCTPVDRNLLNGIGYGLAVASEESRAHSSVG